MDHKIILKCRVCLGEFDEDSMFDLFNEDSKTKKLCEKIEFCCGVRIRESTEMPTKVCLKCFDVTRIWFNFRQMCVNSQVYLESMCKDRIKPPELHGDESDFLEYLLEDLQTFRAEARRSNESLYEINSESSQDSDKEMAEDGAESGDDEVFEALPLEDVDSDSDLEEVMRAIKVEPNTNSKQEEQTPQRSTTKAKRKTTNGTKKSSEGNVPKKYFRPSSPGSYMCSICGNVYTKKNAFTYHMTIHTNLKAHECEICKKSFRQVSELKNHMRRHTGEKPFKCSYCDRHFIDCSEKHRHERVHTNTRPYMCNVCGKSFMYSAILKNHSKLHSGEKAYNCLVCQKAFTLQHQLKAHLQTITHKQREEQFVSAGYDVVYE